MHGFWKRAPILLALLIGVLTLPSFAAITRRDVNRMRAPDVG